MRTIISIWWNCIMLRHTPLSLINWINSIFRVGGDGRLETEEERGGGLRGKFHQFYSERRLCSIKETIGIIFVESNFKTKGNDKSWERERERERKREKSDGISRRLPAQSISSAHPECASTSTTSSSQIDSPPLPPPSPPPPPSLPRVDSSCAFVRSANR